MFWVIYLVVRHITPPKKSQKLYFLYPDSFAQVLKHQNKLSLELSTSNIIKPPYVEAWKIIEFDGLFHFFTQLETN